MNFSGQTELGGLSATANRRGSVLVIVLWMTFGLVSITLYFANAMNFELRTADNRVAGLAAEQAIAGAARYVSYVVTQLATNGTVPNASILQPDANIGDAHFWLIGRDTNNPVGAGQLYFGLVDEGAKLNLNTTTSNTLAALISLLPNANLDLAAGIVDWRDTNGGAYQTYYAMQTKPYLSKSAPFETIDELRLVYGADPLSLVGEDVNRNGVLDASEQDENRNGMLDPGVLEYVTVYSREPNTRTNGSPRVRLNNIPALRSLLQEKLGNSRAQQILPPNQVQGFPSPLAFYLATNMKAEEFDAMANDITSTNGAFIEGRVNINTASETVLASLPGMSLEAAGQLIQYRQSHPDSLGSIAWIKEALSSNRDALNELQRRDYITAKSYQFTADIAALGPYGRGYRRVRMVFDTSEGTPRIIYRQDLSQLGWALGKDVRQAWLSAKATR